MHVVLLGVLLASVTLVHCSSNTIIIDEELLSTLPKEELAAHISGLLGTRPGAAVTVDDLPAQRPPVYEMCGYDCAKSVSVLSGPGQGVFTLDVG